MLSLDEPYKKIWQPNSTAVASVCWWKLPDPIFLKVVTLPSGVTAITMAAAEQASSSGVGSTMQ